jgi:hypothetical protein
MGKNQEGRKMEEPTKGVSDVQLVDDAWKHLMECTDTTAKAFWVGVFLDRVKTMEKNKKA